MLVLGLIWLPVQGQDVRDESGCELPLTLDDQFEAANIVILGTCIRVSTNAIKGDLNIAFAVDSSWKRAIEPVATVHTNPANQCGFPFEEGQRYLVFARKRHQTITTSVCELILPEGLRASATMEELGTGFSPGRPELARNMNLMILGLGIGSILLVAVIVLRKKVFGRSKAA